MIDTMPLRSQVIQKSKAPKTTHKHKADSVGGRKCSKMKHSAARVKNLRWPHPYYLRSKKANAWADNILIPKDLEEWQMLINKSIRNPDFYFSNDGGSRVCLIDKKNGVVYKTPRLSEFRKTQNFSCVKQDEILFQLYRNSRFYDGKYASYSEHKIVTLKGNDTYNDTYKDCPMIICKSIENFTELDFYEKIPKSALHQFEKLGFSMWDVHYGNFVKVKQDQGVDHYIPIDGKFMGLKHGSSFQSRRVEKLREKSGGYRYPKYIDYTR